MRSAVLLSLILLADLSLCVLLQSVPSLSSLQGCLVLIRLSVLASLSLRFLFKRTGDSIKQSEVELLPYLGTLCLVIPVHGRVMELLKIGSHSTVPSWSFLLLTHITSVMAMAFWTIILSANSGSEKVQDSPGKQESKATIRKLLSYSKLDIPYLLGAFCFLTIAVIGQTFIPYYTGRVIDILSSKYEQSAFHGAILLMCLVSVGSSLSAGCRGGLFMFTFSRLNQRIKNLLFKSLMRQEIGFFESTRTGEITSRLSMDTAVMSRSIAANVNIFLRSLVNTVGIYSFMFGISWELTLLTFIESPLTGAAQRLYNKYYQSLAKEVQDSMAKSDQEAGEIISSIKTVRSFATEEEEARRYDTKLAVTQNLKTKREFIRTSYLLFRRLLQLAMQITILYCGKMLIKSGHMTGGNLVSFILYQADVGSYVQTLVHFYAELHHSVGAAEKVFEYLDRTPTISTAGTLLPRTLTGHVEFRNVSFSYPIRPQLTVLKNVTFELKAGEITALVGPSGGGKTTCVSLLERFYEPQSGQILLDGKPIEEYEHKYYHNKLGPVGQEPVLFALSVQGNICYGLQNCPMTAVTAAAQRANAHGFIERMEQGYNTDVGEAGGQLSAGQKQRIAIARALVREPQILILDEATSSLDMESEHTIQQALSRGKGQTILVIAHRLKTVEKADKIIVIENGSVMEVGNHQQLMQQEGCYFRLVQRLFNNGEQGSAE